MGQNQLEPPNKAKLDMELKPAQTGPAPKPLENATAIEGSIMGDFGLNLVKTYKSAKIDFLSFYYSYMDLEYEARKRIRTPGADRNSFGPREAPLFESAQKISELVGNSLEGKFKVNADKDRLIADGKDEPVIRKLMEDCANPKSEMYLGENDRKMMAEAVTIYRSLKKAYLQQ